MDWHAACYSLEETEDVFGLNKEEPTMREKMAKLAKQAVKLLAIELFVPGGTLVVLAILLARGFGSGRLSKFVMLFPTPERDMKGADHPEYALEAY
jgi:hypothetical protein